MKNHNSENSPKSNFLKFLCLFLFIGIVSTKMYSQQYRNINAYIDDFAKNELHVKKFLMEYTLSIVEAQLYSRTKVTAERIIKELQNMNTILIKNDNGFQGNTMLRDSFMRQNKKTIDCLTNGILILNDYEYQSSLPLAEIQENFIHKENQLISYYQELKNYEQDKKNFALCFKLNFKVVQKKNILEYNAYQNILFYKINVIDEKLTTALNTKDKKEVSDCMNMIDLIHQEIMIKTWIYKDNYKDTSLNNATISYSNFIASQREKLIDLFYNYVDDYNALQLLKNSSQPETTESVTAYNNAVKSYNTNKNLFFSVFNNIQFAKEKLYDNWLTINSAFLKRNGKFESIYDNNTINEY